MNAGGMDKSTHYPPSITSGMRDGWEADTEWGRSRSSPPMIYISFS